MKDMYGLFHWHLYKSNFKHQEIINWCDRQFGSDYYILEYGSGKIRYTFFKEEHYNWFLLRWS